MQEIARIFQVGFFVLGGYLFSLDVLIFLGKKWCELSIFMQNDENVKDNQMSKI